MMTMTTLPQSTPACAARHREPPRLYVVAEVELNDDAFVADLLGLEEEETTNDLDVVDEETDTEEDETPVEPAPTDEDLKATVKAERLAVEARVLGFTGSIEELIAAEVTIYTASHEAKIAGLCAGEQTIDGFEAAECLRQEIEAFPRRLEAAVTPPVDWPCRRTQAARIDRWRRLRVLEVVAGLRSCVQRTKVAGLWEWRTCDVHGKLHRGMTRTGDASAPKKDVCQVGELRALSMKIGELAFFEAYRPCLDKDLATLVAPPQWPAELSRAGRSMVAELWRRAGFTRKGDNMIRASRHAGEGTRDLPLPSPLGDPAMPPGAWRMAPDHVVPFSDATPDLVHESEEVGPPAVVETSLPESLLALRDVIGDHGLWVLDLLHRPSTKDKRRRQDRAEAAAGWRPLRATNLRAWLGKVSKGPEKGRHRADVLMGSRTAPGLLERLGLIERLADYSSGSNSQRFRLTPGVATGELKEVTLKLRKSAKNLPAIARPVGPPVPASIVADYRKLQLAPAALNDLCSAAGVEFSSDLPSIKAAVTGNPGAAVYLAALERLRPWLAPDAAEKEARTLYRDPNGHRLQSTAARLPKAVRAHLSFGDGKKLVRLDIRASQLVIMAGRLRAQGLDRDRDIARWCDDVEQKDIYAVLYRLVHGGEPAQAQRDEFKGVAFADLIYCGHAWTRSPENALAQAVRREYPGFYDWLWRTKAKKGNSEFCCEFQRFESKMVLDKLCPALAAADIEVATVHDEIMVREEHAGQAKALFEEALREAGVRGVVR